MGQNHGYETFLITPPKPANPVRLACLGGAKYGQRFKDCLVEMVAREGLRHFKLDGICFNCTESGHGHAPEYSAEAIADGAIEAFGGASAGVWLATTCMGMNPSPWWLLYAEDQVVGNFGDDNVFGQPSPVYRESTFSPGISPTFRTSLAIPIAFQEVMGLNHFTDEDFMNDGVTCIMRGHMFLPIYVNPLYMNDLRWKNFANLLKWAHANATVLMQTKPLLPVTWQKTGTPAITSHSRCHRPYGYSHWDGGHGLVELRNPWIRPQSYALKLDKKAGVPEGVKGLAAVSLYPARVYGHNLAYGDTLKPVRWPHTKPSSFRSNTSNP